MSAPPPLEDSRKRPRYSENPGKQHDSDYQIINQPRRFFKKGKFFMALWVEPLGFSRPSGNQRPESFFETRRFVVVRSKPGHCLCLSVHTYGRQATTKRGVWADEHAAIVPQGGCQVLHPGEPELKKRPIQVKVEGRNVAVDAYSRIDFSRVYTVEYNIPVKNIGRILPQDIEMFETYFTQTVNMASQEFKYQDKTNSSILATSSLDMQIGEQPDVAPCQNLTSASEKQNGTSQYESWNGNVSQAQNPVLDPNALNRLLELPPCKAWSKSDSSMLWVIDNSHITNSALAQWFATYRLPYMGPRTICFVTFREGKMDGNKWTLALHSLLFQLLSQQPLLAHYLHHCFQIGGKDIATPSKIFWESFLALVERATESVTCVLDGLDEACLGNERHEVFESLYEAYCSLEVKSTPALRLNFVITSQPNSEIDRRFRKHLCHFPNDGEWARKSGDEKCKLPSTHHELARSYSSSSEQLVGDY